MKSRWWMTLIPVCMPVQTLFSQVVDERVSLDVITKFRKTQISPAETSVPARNGGGSCLLCGGGYLPPTLLQLFYHRGKGVDGNLVIIPTASPRSDEGDFSRHVALWKDYAWNNVTVVHVNDSKEAMQEHIHRPIRNATAVWVVGGDQQRLWDRFYNTPVIDELRGVIERGGIVGGTSAGAAIASKIMIAGGVTVPTISNGWGLFPNWIIDQHFSQRGRFERLAKSIDLHPDCIGIGIDESTGIVVDGNGVEVVGNGSVYVVKHAKLDEVSLHAGSRIQTFRASAGTHLSNQLSGQR